MKRNLPRRWRVALAQFVFYGAVIYAFIFMRIPIAGFQSPQGLLGLALVILGVATRSLSAGTIRKNAELASTGLYVLVRHPLYLGSFLLAIGVNLIIWNPLIAGVTAALLLITYVPTIRQEETYLAGKFGEDWTRFAAQTPRLIPRLSRLGQVFPLEWSYAQWRRNHEYEAVLGATATLILLFVYERL